jgi:hypothetical protein
MGLGKFALVPTFQMFCLCLFGYETNLSELQVLWHTNLDFVSTGENLYKSQWYTE